MRQLCLAIMRRPMTDQDEPPVTEAKALPPGRQQVMDDHAVLQTRLLGVLQGQLGVLQDQLGSLREIVLAMVVREIQKSHRNPFNAFGQKCFSQNDEDGITLEIVRRLGLERGTFAEFGVGTGMENNTLILGALGWTGFWVGGEDLAFDAAATRRLRFLKSWISCENITRLALEGIERIGGRVPDVLSLDLDGNDIHLIRTLLQAGLRPRLVIVEYNAKFPPPVLFEIAYDPGHIWQDDDYFGASLESFARMFASFGYKLVCCNAQSGSNAFFVDAAFADRFTDVPEAISEIYVPPHYHPMINHGHPPSVRTVARIFED